MKIFSATQVRNWDNHTIQHEPVSSVDLMERAAKACAEWILNNYKQNDTAIKIFCGHGNNGGDGLAIARILSSDFSLVSVYIIETSANGSPDFISNLGRLEGKNIPVNYINTETDIPVISSSDLVIDAIFGTGLNKPVTGLVETVINQINKSEAEVVAIDIPSGMYADQSSLNNPVIRAKHSLTFQSLKLAFLLAENNANAGEVHVLEIGLSNKYARAESSNFELIEPALIKTIYKPRNQFTHKGNYGHACLLVGSKGIMGAATLAAKACVRTGAGKLTTFIPEAGLEIMQIAVPEAIVFISGKDALNTDPPSAGFDAIGIGPGIGLNDSHDRLLSNLFNAYAKPVVIDADALNILSTISKRSIKLPQGSVLTPHTREFERLFGKSNNDFDRVKLALQKAEALGCYIILKGHHTLIATPSGFGYFNSTGNAGMATGGSGDVLTGIITSLLAQGYSSLDASILGVYLHGKAGDIAAENLSEEALTATDIIDNIGAAFISIS